MRTIELSDHLYERVASAAMDRGQSVAQFAKEAVGNELGCSDEDIQRRFTPEVLASLDRTLASVRAGNVMTFDELEVKFQELRTSRLSLG